MDHIFTIYSLIYIPLALSVFIDNLKTQKQTIWFYIIILTLFRGLRWNCGTDWYWYELSFREVDLSNFYYFPIIESGDELKILEPGWALLLAITKSLINSYTFFLLVSNFINLFIHYKFAIAFTKKPIVYFALYECTASFFPVRQDLAVAVSLLAFMAYFTFRDAIKYKFSQSPLFILYGFLSGLIHQTAYLMLPVSLFIKRIRWSLVTYYVVMMCSFLFAIVLSDYIASAMLTALRAVGLTMADTVARYLEGEESLEFMSNPIYSLILNMILLGIIFKFLNNERCKVYTRFIPNESSRVIIFSLINYFVLGIVVLQLFGNTLRSLSRMSSYCAFALPLLLAICCDNIENKTTRKQLLFFIFCYCLFRYTRTLGVYPELHFPYMSIWGAL